LSSPGDFLFHGGGFLAVLLPITSMEQPDNARLAHLRSQLASARSERNRLIRQINSPVTTAVRKSHAKARYAKVNANLQGIAAELEKLITAMKLAEAPKKA
jgi:hypothetical protein